MFLKFFYLHRIVRLCRSAWVRAFHTQYRLGLTEGRRPSRVKYPNSLNGKFMHNEHSIERLAHELIEVVPMVMQELRAEVRRQRDPDLSVLQIRVLAFLNRHPGSPLSAVAEHVGLTLPSMSSQVTGLVGRNMIDRSVSAEDRRFVTLTLTDQGRYVMEAALRGAEASITPRLDTLSPDERAALSAGLDILRRRFASTDAST